jgi:hypothetical protein
MTWYNKVTADIAYLPDFIDHYNRELELAKSECRIKGIVERNISALPGITEHSFKKLKLF